MKRESFSSRASFLLVSAGCAIGIGNVWKFPYIAGECGGGVFVLLYILFLLLMGVPILTMELAIGRASRHSAVKGMAMLEPKGSKWHIYGWACLAGCYVLMMYYTTVSGWMLNYCVKFLVGVFDHLPDKEVPDVFSAMLANPGEMAIYTGVTILFCVLVCSLGIRQGVENVASIMMVCLLILIALLAVRSAQLPNAGAGLEFYLMPDLARAAQMGFGKIVTAAMNQSFYTLSLGVAAMEIFGSYMPRERTLTGEAIRICALDTFIAITAGLIIFPACFSYGVQPDRGPALIFLALPKVFLHMKIGWIWGTLFFLFMTFAALSTIIAIFENIIAICIDSFGWSRMKSSVINFFALSVSAVPCILGSNRWSGVRFFGGRGILEFEDFLASNLLLPIGSLVFLLFCVSKRGWGFEHYLAEVNAGQGVRLSPKLRTYFLYVLPVLILVLLIQGLL